MKFEWKPVSPEERAETKGKVESDAPAEIVFWQFEEEEDRTSSYTRVKIYRPEKVEGLTRIVFRDSGYTDIVVKARLTLPDGKMREFGKADIRERELVKGGEAKEKFLAVQGIEPGSIVELWQEEEWGSVRTILEGVDDRWLQRSLVPVRRVEGCFHYPNEKIFDFRVFLLNAHGAELKKDERAKTITVTASNLPALLDEPFLATQSDYVSTVVAVTMRRTLQIEDMPEGERISTKIDPNAGPWAIFATAAYGVRKARAMPTKRVRELAAKLTEGAVNETEKARRIHRHVQVLYRKYTGLPKDTNFKFAPTGSRNRTLDDVLDFDKERQSFRIDDSDFAWLAVGLYEAAGLETSTVMLPDRRQMRFDPDFVSPLFLPGVTARVKVDGVWRFSYPIEMPTWNWNPNGIQYIRFADGIAVTSFGMLPWYFEGQKALVAQPGQQELLDVPLSPAAESLIGQMGSFKLDTEGTLKGQGRRRLTGHAAVDLRRVLAPKSTEERERLARDRLKELFPSGEVHIDALTGIEDPELPLEITFSLEWPGYAVVTRDRMVVRPNVFRAEAKPVFPADMRRHPVSFSWRRQEIDRMGIQLPPGYAPEALEAPPSFPGKALSCEVKYSFDPKRRLIAVNRDLNSDVIDVPVEAYSKLKAWFDAVDRTDTHELVFVKTETPQAAATPATN